MPKRIFLSTIHCRVSATSNPFHIPFIKPYLPQTSDVPDGGQNRLQPVVKLGFNSGRCH